MALELDGSEDAQVSTWDDMLIKLMEIVYADDMITPAADHSRIQRRADIVSAFAIVFGMNFSKLGEQGDKLRAFSFLWGGEANGKKVPDSIVIHVNPRWSEKVVKLKSCGELRFLGIEHPGQGEYLSQLQTCKDIITKDCAMIGARACSAESKLVGLYVFSYKAIEYKTAYTSLTLKQLYQLDKPVSKLLKRMTRNMQSFPSEMLYVQRQHGGLGYKQLSHHTIKTKIGALHRSGFSDAITQATRHGLLSRNLRVSNLHTVLGQLCQLIAEDVIEVNPLFIDSILQHYATAGITMFKGGQSLAGTRDEMLRLDVQTDTVLNDDSRKKLNIVNVADCTQLVDGSIEWNNRVMSLDDVVRFGVSTIPPQGPRSLRAGQCWLSNGTKACIRSVYEILGFTSDKLVLRKWTVTWQPIPAPLWLSPGELKLDIEYRTKVGGSDLLMTMDELFGPIIFAVLLSPDIIRRSGVFRAVYSIASDLLPRPRTCPYYAAKLRDFSDTMDASCFASTIIYTDGSFRYKDDFVSELLCESRKVESKGALVVCSGRATWLDEVIPVLCIEDMHLLQPDSVFTAELIMILCSLYISKLCKQPFLTVSDSNSNIQLIQKYFRRRYQAHHSHIDLLRLADKLLSRPTQLQHVHSHKHDMKVPMSQWPQNIIGNYIADRVVSDDFSVIGKFNLNFITLSIKTVMKDFIQQLDWCLMRNGMINVRDIDSLISENKRNQYLKSRDENRMKRGESECWKLSSIQLAAKSYNYGGKHQSLASNAQSARIYLDKHWHGRNRAKGIKDVDLRLEAEKCVLCGKRDSQQHIFSECENEHVKKIREVVISVANGFVMETSLKYPVSATLLQALMNIHLLPLESHRIWTCIWTVELRQRFSEWAHLQQQMLRKDKDIVKAQFWGLCAFFAQGAKAVMNWRQYAIDVKEDSKVPPPKPFDPVKVVLKKRKGSKEKKMSKADSINSVLTKKLYDKTIVYYRTAKEKRIVYLKKTHDEAYADLVYYKKNREILQKITKRRSSEMNEKKKIQQKLNVTSSKQKSQNNLSEEDIIINNQENKKKKKKKKKKHKHNNNNDNCIERVLNNNKSVCVNTVLTTNNVLCNHNISSSDLVRGEITI